MADRSPAQLPDNRFDAVVGVRWSDIDALGHVNNVAFLQLLEEARVQFLGKIGTPTDHEIGVLAARHEIDYLRPLLYGPEPVQIPTWVERIGRSSFTVGYAVIGAEGQTTAVAKTVIVAIDPVAGGAALIPEPLRAELERYLAAP